MSKKTYTERAREHVAETKNALQTFFDELNQGQQKKILRNEKVRPILEMYGVVESEARAVSETVTAEGGMEYEYGRLYYDNEDGKTYRCERTGEKDGGKIVLDALPHELAGSYFKVVSA